MKILLGFAYFLYGLAWAAPGAHGPGGEHLDAPAQAAGSAATPRLESHSELFELVAHLAGGELSILIDRYATNEPVLGASVVVALGEAKADAAFHADHGDYAVDDPALLKLLAAPGEHGLVFTIAAGADVDLLDGTLAVAADHSHDDDAHDHALERWLIGAGVLLALLAAAALLWRRRHARRAALALGATLLLAATMAAAAPGAHGPGGEHLDSPAASGGGGLARLPDGSVNVPKLAQRRMEIRTLIAVQSEVAAAIELSGRVVIDPNAGGRVQPVHGGRIEPGGSGLPIIGQAVKRGQVLAYVRHHAEPYTEANQKALLAQLRAERAVLEQRVARLASLEGSVPRKEIDAARVELQALREREAGVGASLASREALVAPLAGVIAAAHPIAGQVVDARDVLYEIVDPARVMVEVALADPALAQRIRGAQLRELPGVQLRLLGAGRSLRDGVLPVLFQAGIGKGSALAIGQPVTVVAALDERLKGYALPAQAVARNPANEPVVWIKSGAERFIPQPVQVRALDAQNVVVLRGLGADNRVVVQGAALLGQIR